LAALSTSLIRRTHGKPGTRMSVANESPGVNTNILSPPTFIDEPSGNGALNGIPVTVTASGTDRH
jgi:hypothetical protein